MNLRICFLAPSGYGKSTAVRLLQKSYVLENIKIADPLYDMQSSFYERLGISINDKQDGELLQFLGYKVRKERPSYLLDVFYEKLGRSECDIITNDDCRPNDYEFLKSNGFVFIKINGVKRDRDDHSKADDKSSLEWQDVIPYDYEVNNFGSLGDYESLLIEVVKKIRRENQKLILGG